MAYVPRIKDNDWASVRQALQKLQSNSVWGPGSTPTFAGLTLSGLTAKRLLSTDGDKALTSVNDLTSWVAGTANEIDITDDLDGTITIGIVNPLIVSKGGTGAATLTDHGILIGSGTDAITPLGVATNGQLPIGSTGADPVLAVLSEGEGIDITNGAGTISIAGELATTANKGIAAFSDSYFTVTDGVVSIIAGGGLSHNDLGGLQGGTTSQYYHLTSAEHTELTTWLADVTLSDGGSVGLGSGTLTCAGATVNGLVTVDQNADAIGLNIDSAATTLTNYGLQVVTGAGAGAAYIAYGDGNNGCAYLGLPNNQSNAGNFIFLRNLTATSTDSAVVYIWQDHADDNQPALEIQQDGTGPGLLVNGNISCDGEMSIDGGVTISTNIIIPDNGYIGSVSDTDAIQIAATGNVTVSQHLNVSGDANITGHVIFQLDNGHIGYLDNSPMLVFNNANDRTEAVGDFNIANLTASRLVASDVDKNLESTALASWVTGTANRVTVADDGDGTITLSGPQDFHTGASPAFTGLAVDTNTLYVDSVNHRVGIGTVSPSYKLHIVHDDYPAIGFSWAQATGYGEFYFSEGATFFGALGVYGSNYADATVRNGIGIISGVNNSGFIYIRTKTGGGYYDRMSIANDGTVTVNSLTASRLLASDASKGLVSVADLSSWVAGTANQITVTSDGDGTLTLSGPQDLHTGASPTFAGLTVTDKIYVIPAQLHVLMGYLAGSALGDDNYGHTFLGDAAGKNVCGTASYDVYIGFGAGEGVSGQTTGNNNVGVGTLALYGITTGTRNMALGHGSYRTLTTGTDNAGIGYYTGRYVIGSYNAFIGSWAGYGQSPTADASYNTGVGAYSLYSLTTAQLNTVIGSSSGYALTSGSSNVFVGYEAGKNQTTNSNLLIVDNRNRSSAANELTKSLLYGVFAADPANQTLRCNGKFGAQITPLEDVHAADTVRADVAFNLNGTDGVTQAAAVGTVCDVTALAGGIATAQTQITYAADGVYANPTSITIQNGRITAIS